MYDFKKKFPIMIFQAKIPMALFSHQLKKLSFLPKNFNFSPFTPIFLANFSNFLKIKSLSHSLSVKNRV